MGGDCLNFGCVPSKALLRDARLAAEARAAARVGTGGEGDPDLGRVMARVRRLRAQLAPHDSAERFAGLGVDVFFGEGRFVGRDVLEVEGRRLRFARAVVATGARPAVPPLPGLAEVPYLTNESVFSLTERPARLAVLGAGPIGCELAQAFQRLGSEVTLLDRVERVLSRDDPDAAEVVRRRLVAEGVTLRLGVEVARVERLGEGVRLVLAAAGSGGAAGAGAGEVVEADALLLAVGRAPNVEGLGLEAAGVRFSGRGVEVDARLRTSNPRIYASGDVASAFQFTHMADAMSRLVLANALFKGRGRVAKLVVPWCTFTDPEVAHVGMPWDEARAAGDRVRTLSVALEAVDRAVLDGETEGFARVHVASRGWKRGRILGATMVGAHAGEAIGEMALAITAGLTMKQVGATIHPYPTQAEAWKRLADAWQRTRLTPRLARLLGWWLARARRG
jgi:pyruvate/2-oxoglutarate dehydrogenase complex dihydrolipoamide dehydrogenase (E3) component